MAQPSVRPGLQPKADVRRGVAHRRLHHRPEVLLEFRRVAHRVRRSMEYRRDPQQLLRLPVVADSAQITAEGPGARSENAVEIFRSPVFVLSVGEEYGVPDRRRMAVEE